MAYGLWGLPNKGVSPTLASKAGIKGWEITSANPFNNLTFDNERRLLLCSALVVV